MQKPAPTKTLKVRIKDKHAPLLREMARSVNFVWNYLNEPSSRAIKERSEFLSEYDLHPYTKGAGKELGLHSQTLQCIAKEYVARRKQFKTVRLNWRRSGGAKRSLGWIPVNTGAAVWKHGQVYHNGHYFKCGIPTACRNTNSAPPGHGRRAPTVLPSQRARLVKGTLFLPGRAR